MPACLMDSIQGIPFLWKDGNTTGMLRDKLNHLPLFQRIATDMYRGINNIQNRINSFFGIKYIYIYIYIHIYI